MYAFLMPGKVVDGTEPFCPRTVRFVALEQLFMPSFMLSIQVNMRVSSELDRWHTFCLMDTCQSTSSSGNRI